MLPAVIAVAMLLSACTTYTTPDGYSFSSAHRTRLVLATLGVPEMIEEHEAYYFGPYTSTTYTYLGRGYVVKFINERVRGVTPITDADRADTERRVKAYREEVSRIRLGDSAADVIAKFGNPDHVIVGHYEGEVLHTNCEGVYRGQLEQNPPAEWIAAYWKRRYIFMVVQNGRVKSVRPILKWDWEQVLHEPSPTN